MIRDGTTLPKVYVSEYGTSGCNGHHPSISDVWTSPNIQVGELEAVLGKTQYPGIREKRALGEADLPQLPTVSAECVHTSVTNPPAAQMQPFNNPASAKACLHSVHRMARQMLWAFFCET